MKEFIKEQLEHRSEKLNKLISDIDNDITSELSFKLKNAVEMLQQEQASNKPLIITLLGGTGVGKSYLFSALHGVKDLSPSSDSERAFTQKLIISCEKSQSCWAPTINSEDLIFIDEIFSIDGLMIIDTPDTDSDNLYNKKLASEAVNVSDIVVYVTDPEKMKNKCNFNYLKKWSGKKLWYFIVNKSDKFNSEEERTEFKTQFIELLKSTFNKELDDRKATCDFSKYIFFFNGREKNKDEEFLTFKNMLLKNKTRENTEAVHDKEKLNAFVRLSDSNNGNTIINQLQEQIDELTKINNQLDEKYDERLNEFTNDVHVSEEIKNSYIHHFCNAICGKSTFAMSPFFNVVKFLYRNKTEDDLNKRLNDGIISDYKIQKCYSNEKDILNDKGFNIGLLQQSEKALVNISQNKIDIADLAIKEANLTWNFYLFKIKKWDFYLFLANLAPVIFFSLMLYHSLADWITGNWLPTNFFVHGFVIIILSAIIGFSILWSKITNANIDALISQHSHNNNELKKIEMKEEVKELEKIKFGHFPLMNAAIARLTEINRKLKDICNNAKEWHDKTHIPENYGLEVGK